MMTPLRCERRGGNQDRVSVREVVDKVKFCGGPLGTIESKTIIFIIIILIFGYDLTILCCSYVNGCCRPSSSAGVSCDVTRVVGVW